MSADENKAIIRRFVETVWNGHDTSAVGDFHADAFTLNGEPYSPSQFASGLEHSERLTERRLGVRRVMEYTPRVDDVKLII